MKRQRYQSKALYEKKQKIRRLKIAGLWVLVFLFLGLTVYVSRLPQMQIDTVEVDTLQYGDSAALQQLVEQQLEGKYIWLYPRSNSFLYPRHIIQNSILEAYPAIKSLDLDVDSFSVLVVSTEEYDPVATVCVNPTYDVSPYDFDQVIAVASSTRVVRSASSSLPYVTDRSDQEVCYVLNNEGTMFATVPQDFDITTRLQFVSPAEDQTVSLVGMQYIEPAAHKKLLQFVEQLKTKDVLVQSVWTKDTESLTLVTDDDMYIHVQMREDFERLHENFEIVTSELEQQGIRFTEIDYIDLRFGDRVYYRMRNGVEDTEIGL